MIKENNYISVQLIYKYKYVITMLSSCGPDDGRVCMIWQVMKWYLIIVTVSEMTGTSFLAIFNKEACVAFATNSADINGVSVWAMLKVLLVFQLFYSKCCSVMWDWDCHSGWNCQQDECVLGYDVL
jgi:hypothetical protein